jgi:hypothetical protein
MPAPPHLAGLFTTMASVNRTGYCAALLRCCCATVLMTYIGGIPCEAVSVGQSDGSLLSV